MTRLRHTLVLVLFFLVPLDAFAQADLGIAIEGLVSIQPIDDSWVGSPYLSEGIGGQAAGISIGANVITPGGLAIVGELSTTLAFQVIQTGRLVPGGGSFGHEGSATANLRDSLVSGLIGYATSNGSQRIVIAGGISRVITNLTQDGDPVDERFGEFGLEGRRFIALTGGMDFLRRLSPRTSLLIGARYSWLGRSENAAQTGAGAHILRIGAGIRARLND